MTISTLWKIDSLECRIEVDGYSDVVYNVHWKLYAMEGDQSVSIPGVTQVTFNPYDPGYQFIPYDQLTEEIVISWTQAAIGQGQVTEMEAQVTAMLEAILNPVVEVKPLPWTSAAGA